MARASKRIPFQQRELVVNINDFYDGENFSRITNTFIFTTTENFCNFAYSWVSFYRTSHHGQYSRVLLGQWRRLSIGANVTNSTGTYTTSHHILIIQDESVRHLVSNDEDPSPEASMTLYGATITNCWTYHLWTRSLTMVPNTKTTFTLYLHQPDSTLETSLHLSVILASETIPPWK